MQQDVLELFSPATAEWFTNTFGEPTDVQKAAWPAIAAGKPALVSAPTGTGKTLSAFLIFIDRLNALARAGELKEELYLIYISPSNPWPGISGRTCGGRSLASRGRRGRRRFRWESAPGTRPRRTVRG